jgi:methionine-rich copper-binding protein CopC
MRNLIAGLGLLWTSGSALAHPELLETTPRDGSIVALSPSEVRLTFTERFEPRLSGAEITDVSGKRVNASRLRAEGSQAIIPLREALSPGLYRVNWHVVGADTHRVQGTITFELKP